MQADELTDYEVMVEFPVDYVERYNDIKQWLDDKSMAGSVIAKAPRYITATHPYPFASTRHVVGFKATITFTNRDDALLFKLTWGGDIDEEA